MAGRAVVVGGGIGGLASAVALRRRSWQVTVLEQRSSISEVGAGITLWPNALRALDATGVGDRIRSVGLAQVAGGIRDSSGKWLSRTDTGAMARRFGDGMIVLQRAELSTALHEALPGIEIRTSTRVTSADADGSVMISTRDGTVETIRGDVVVGADGVRSAVRASLWPKARIRPIGMTAWRLVGRLADSGTVPGGDTWGRGDYDGLTPLADGRIYAWFATPVAAGAPAEPGEALDWLRKRFGSWHPPLPQLLTDATPDALLRNDLVDLAPLTSLVGGRVALVGDAAHAMTPNLGHGACQALEDAVELAAALDQQTAGGNDLAGQLRVYGSRRLARVHRVARRSRTADIAAALRGRVPTAIRNALVSAIPATMSLRALDAVVDWTPPTA